MGALGGCKYASASCTSTPRSSDRHASCPTRLTLRALTRAVLRLAKDSLSKPAAFRGLLAWQWPRSI